MQFCLQQGLVLSAKRKGDQEEGGGLRFDRLEFWFFWTCLVGILVSAGATTRVEKRNDTSLSSQGASRFTTQARHQTEVRPSGLSTFQVCGPWALSELYFMCFEITLSLHLFVVDQSGPV